MFCMIWLVFYVCCITQPIYNVLYLTSVDILKTWLCPLLALEQNWLPVRVKFGLGLRLGAVFIGGNGWV